MLWAKIDSDGTLTIEADEPIEVYALRQWEKQRASGKARLQIQTGHRVDVSAMVAEMGKDLIAFQAWKKRCETNPLIEETK